MIITEKEIQLIFRLLSEIRDDYQPFDQRERELFRSYINGVFKKYTEVHKSTKKYEHN